MTMAMETMSRSDLPARTEKAAEQKMQIDQAHLVRFLFFSDFC